MSDQGVPFNIQAEQAVLAEVLFNNQALAKVSEILTPDDFHEPVHTLVFKLALDAAAQGIRATPITLKDHLLGDLAHGVKAWEYVANLLGNASGSRHVESHAKVVHNLAVRRRIMSIAADLNESVRVMGLSEQPEEIARDAIGALHDATSQRGQSGTTADIQTLGDGLLDHIAAKLRGDVPEAPTSGLIDLDKAIGGGLQAKRLLVIAGRPGAGKTVVMCSLARRSAKAGHGALVFSLEIPKEEIIARIASDEMATSAELTRRIEYVRVMNGWVNDTEYEAVDDAVRILGKYPIVVDDAASLTVSEIEVRTRMVMDDMARKGQRLRTVWIDYLQRIKPSKDYAGNRVEELGHIALQLKELGKRLGVCVLLFCQLNRGVEGRDDKRPQVSDLRGSGEIEEHADIIALLYREAYYIEKSTDYQKGDPGVMSIYLAKQHEMEMILGKNRLGPVRTVTVYCDVKFSSVQSQVMIWPRASSNSRPMSGSMNF